VATAAPIPESGPASTLEIGDGWSGRVTLTDPAKVQCTQPKPGTFVINARTSEFGDFDSGSANPGRDYTLFLVAADDSSGAVEVEFVTSDGVHVQSTGTEESGDAEIHISESGDGVSFLSRGTAFSSKGGPSSIVVAGAVRC
jgi:hypothetical protein